MSEFGVSVASKARTSSFDPVLRNVACFENPSIDNCPGAMYITKEFHNRKVFYEAG